jgi:sugar lactone lactonase YvrE
MAATAKAEVFLENVGSDICCPFFDSKGTLHFILKDAGEIYELKNGSEMKLVHTTSGEATGAGFDANGMIYCTDLAHTAVLVAQPEEHKQDVVVAVYEHKPLRGPNSVAVKSTGEIFFTDGGPFGSTGLHNPAGSVFMISGGIAGQILRPISLEQLAYPSGIALDPSGTILYVTEMMTNRILRYTQMTEGVWHGSVFYQLSGRVGPSCIAVDKQGSLYVGHFESRQHTDEGRVLIISPQGELTSTISTQGPEISGVACGETCMYITEHSTGNMYVVDL